MSKLVIRKRMWAAVPALGLAVATTFSLAGPALPAGATVPKLYAAPNGTGTACSKTANCSLLTAQSQALPFTTIVLAGGVYTNYNPVIAVTDLTISGPKDGSAILMKSNASQPAPNAATPSGDPVSSLLYVGPAATRFTMQYVTISGALAKQNPNQRFAGVYVRSSNASFNKDSIVNTYPDGGFTGIQNGTAFYVRSDNASSSNVVFRGGSISGYNKNGVVCADNTTTCTIDQSTVTGHGGTTVTAQNGIEIFGATGSVSRNTVQNNAYTGGTPQASGILIIDAVSGFVVTQNTVAHNDNQIYVYDDGGTYPTTSANAQITKNMSNNAAAYDGISLDSVTGAVVQQNKINTTGSSGGFGIGLYGATNASVVRNTIHDAFSDGIYVGGPGNLTAETSGSTFTSNKVYSSGGAGIHADTSSHNNTFSKNTTRDSDDYDVRDEGTANTWTSTHCTTHAESIPSGLC